MKLGIVQDIHGDYKKLKKLISRFNKENLDALIVNGDLCGYENKLKEMRIVLAEIAKSKNKVFIIPGSHESPGDWAKAMKRYRKNRNIFDCTYKRNRRINMGGYDLVFLPGSDYASRKAGFLERASIAEIRKTKSKRRTKEYKEYYPKIVKFFLIHELRKIIKNPKKTILFSHIPPLFHSKNGVDIAEFGIVKKDFIVPEIFIDKNAKVADFIKKYRANLEFFHKGSILLLGNAIEFKKAGSPVAIVKQNRGNKVLRKYVEKLGIKRMVSGHFHEAGGIACTLRGRKIKPSKYSKELFYNPGPAFEGRGGIITLKGNKIKYRNVKV